MPSGNGPAVSNWGSNYSSIELAEVNVGMSFVSEAFSVSTTNYIIAYVTCPRSIIIIRTDTSVYYRQWGTIRAVYEWSASPSQKGRSWQTKDDVSHRLRNLRGRRERLGAIFQSELGGTEVTAGTWPESKLPGRRQVFVTLYSIDRRTMLQMLVSRTGAVGSDRCSPQYAFSDAPS